jgi:4-amino-4-deoxy-L-arabinose transferase-like glycosyltransferase
MRLERFLAGLALLVCLAWAIAYVDFPFGWDQGIAAWIGSIICEGGVPYRDGWDCSGPVSYFIPALAQSVFGRNTFGLRILDLAFLLAATATLYRVASRMTNRFCGLWAAILFYLWYASGSYWHTAQRDGWAAMLMLICMGPLLVSSTCSMAPVMFGAGGAVGLAVLIKPIFAPYLMLPLIVVVQQFWSGRRRLALTNLLSMLVGLSIPIVAVVGWFVQHGALADLVDAYVLYPRRIYAASAQPSWDFVLREIIRQVAPGKVMSVVFPLALLGTIPLRNVSRIQTLLLGMWTLIALAAVIAQKRFFLYHWLPVYPPMAIWFAMGIYRVHEPGATFDRLTPRVRRVWINTALAVTLLHVAAHPLYNVMSSAGYLAGWQSRDKYLHSFGIPAAEVLAAERLAELTTPDDYVLVWGWNTNILYLANRKSPTRFGFSMPLLMGPGTETRERYRAEFMQALGDKPIKYVVLGEVAERILGAKFELNEFPEFYEYLLLNFQPDGEIGEVKIWTARHRRISEDAATAKTR